MRECNMVCKNCGAETPESSKFCYNCGNELDTSVFTKSKINKRKILISAVMAGTIAIGLCGGILVGALTSKEPKREIVAEKTEKKIKPKETEREEKVEPYIITSSVTEIKTEVNHQVKLEYEITGGDKKLKPKVFFECADNEIATVDADGSVTGVSSGKTVITAKCDEAEYFWNVEIIPEAKISSDINKMNIVLIANSGDIQYSINDEIEEMFYVEKNLGEQILLNYSTEGGDITYECHLKSSDESIVKVNDEGIITPVNDGDAIIVASFGEFATYSWNISIKKEITAIVSRIEGNTMYYYEGENRDNVFIALNGDVDEYVSLFSGKGQERCLELYDYSQYIEYDYDNYEYRTINKEIFISKFNEDKQRELDSDSTWYQFNENGYFYGFPVYVHIKNGKILSYKIPFIS